MQQEVEAKYRMGRAELWGIMKALGVKNYIELCFLHYEKVGYPLNHRTITVQISREDALSCPMSRSIKALEIIIKKERPENETSH